MAYNAREELINQMREDVYLNLTVGVLYPNKQLGTVQLSTPDETITFADFHELQEFFAEQLPYMREHVVVEYGEDIADIVC